MSWASVEWMSLTVAIIIPTYNERENLQALVPQIIDVLDDYGVDGSIIIVDDSSPDGTADLAKELSEKLGKMVVIVREGKLGIGSAYKDGFRKALSLGFEGMIEMDADGSHNPLSIPEFVAKLEEGFDFVVGSRYIPGGKIPNWPFSRRMISKATSFFTRVLFGLKTHDPTSGFRAYSARALNRIDLSKVRSDGYAFQVEMVVRCERMGLRVCEIPIEFVDRFVGKSKLGGTEMLRFIKAIIRLVFEL